MWGEKPTGWGFWRRAGGAVEFLDDVSTVALYRADTLWRRSLVTVFVFDAAGAEAVPRTVGALREHVAASLADYPIYRSVAQRSWRGLVNAHWRPAPDFDLANHVYARTVGAPGWGGLMREAMAMAEEPRDDRRPPWEVVLLNGVGADEAIPPGALVVAVRLDHVAVDGAAAAQFSRRLFPAAPGTAPAAAGGGGEPRTPTAVDVLAAAARGLPRKLRAVASEIPKLVRPADQRLPGAGPVGALAVQQPWEPVSDSVVLDLDAAQRVRSLVAGATLNDVLLATVASALRTYFLEAGTLPAVPLLCAVPVALEGPGGGTTPVGNRLAGFLVPLPTTVADPVDRLRAVVAETAWRKATPEVWLPRPAERAFIALSAPLAGTIARRVKAGSSPVSVGLSNVRRPAGPRYLGDARLVRIHSVPGLVPGLLVGHGAWNHEDTVALAFAANRAAISDPARYLALLRHGFGELLAAVDAGAGQLQPAR